MEITLGHTYRWHATTETYISLACNLLSPYLPICTIHICYDNNRNIESVKK